MEELLKMAVNYGLGIFLAVGIAISFLLFVRDKDKQSYEREQKLMKFMEEHSLVTQNMLETNIEKQADVARYQRQEHEAIMASIGLVKDSLNSLNNSFIAIQRSSWQK